jgi:hypothetical protein
VLSKGRYRRTRGPTTDAFDDVVAKAYAAVRINLDLGR